MNWGKIATYAAAILIAQVVIGFFEGSLSSPSSNSSGLLLLIASSAVSFIVCGAIFAHLAAGQPLRPFDHAFAALALQAVVAFALSQALANWVGRPPFALVAIELLVLVCALLVGTAVGSSFRRSARRPADA